jgi:transposase
MKTEYRIQQQPGNTVNTCFERQRSAAGKSAVKGRTQTEAEKGRKARKEVVKRREGKERKWI